MHPRYVLAFLLPATLATLACQQSTQSTVTPANTAAEHPLAPVAALDPNSFGLAAADLSIDLATNVATLTPVRGATAIGDDYSELGLTPAFNSSFGDNFRVVGLRTPAPGEVEVDVEITHPFSPSIRPDLGIFNVKCTVVTDAAPTSLDGNLFAPGILLNADGYSDTWEATHPETRPGFALASIHPYIVLHEDPTSAPFDFQAPAGWNVLFPGQSSTDTLHLSLGAASTFQARLFLTADYGQSAVRATRQTPDYQLPKFAGNAAWKVEVTEIANDLEEGSTSSTAQYEVNIWDWKHGQTLGSDVASATLSVPGVTTSAQTLSLTGTGTDPTPLTATALITNAANALEGTYTGVVTITDAAQGVGLEEDLATPISFASYTTYMTFPVEVVAVALPPTAAFTRCLGGNLSTGITETFDASTSTPGSAPIANYEWDWDYDGSNFTVDDTGIVATHAFSTVGTPTVALRVSPAGMSVSDIATEIMGITGAPTWSSTGTQITSDTFWNRFEDQNRHAPILEIDSMGIVHLVYYKNTSGFGIYHHTFDPGDCPATWSPAETAYSGPGGSTNVAMAITPNDDIHVVYQGGSPAGVRHIRKTLGAWTLPQPITTSPGSGSWSYGWLEANAAGELGYAGFFAPPQDINTVNNGGIPAVPQDLYFTGTQSGVWLPQQLIGSSDYAYNFPNPGSYNSRIMSISMAALPSNDFVVVWDTLKSAFTGGPAAGNTAMTRWTRQTAGVWAPQSTLSAVPFDSFRCYLAAAPDGTLWLANTPVSSSVQLANYNGIAWSTFSTVISGLSGSAHPHLYFASDGEAMLLASGSSGLGNAILGKRFMQTDTIGTVAAMPTDTVVPLVPQFLQRFPASVKLQDGRWLMLHQYTDNTAGVQWEGTELYSRIRQ